MNAKLDNIIREAENNIYIGVNLSKGAIVFLWTLLCLFLINKSNDFIYTAVLGGAYYISLVVLSLWLFKGINKYLCFPEGDKKMPVFIGHRADIILTFPIFLMSLIGIISNLLTATDFFPAAAKQMNTAGSAVAWEFAVRSILLPLIAFAEELLNLLMVSFLYKNIRLSRYFRLIGSILAAALLFGILHTFGWGINAAILTGISYIPVFVVTLYTGNIWISFLAHLYNDLISFTKYYYGSYHFIAIAVISLIPAIWAVRTMLSKTHRQ